MKILMVCDVQGNLGDAIRIQKIAAHVHVALGHDLRILNVADYRLPRRKLLLRPAVFAAFGAHLLHARSTAQYGAYKRLLDELLRERLRDFEADAVLVEGVLQGGLLAGACARLDVPLVTDVHGLASSEYEENPFYPVDRRKADYFRRVESDAFRHSAQVWSVSAPMREHVIQHGALRARVPIVRNGADLHAKKAVFCKAPFRAGYGGILAFWEDVDAFLDLGKPGALGPHTELHLAGSGPLEAHVRARLGSEKLAVTFHGRLARPESLDWFTTLQAGIAPSVDTVTRQVACPIKVFDYMAAGLPVVTPKVGEWADIVESQDAGIVTKRSSAEEFASALDVLRAEKTWNEKASNARQAIVRRYNWDAVLEPVGESLVQATGR